MGTIVTLIGKLFKPIFYILYYTGIFVFAIPLGLGLLYEIVTGNNLGEVVVMNTVCNVLWYACFVICPLIFAKNIITTVRKEKFSYLRLIFKREGKKGILAPLGGNIVDLRSASNLSGVVFGKSKGKYAVMPEETDGHILIIGGAGSGKTAAIAIPTLMSWKKQVFAIDIKGELYQKTKKARNEAQIKVFNPTDPNAYGYDPYFALKTARDISSAARQLAMSICPLPAEVKDPFWIKSAQNMLTGFIVYLFSEKLSFSESMRDIKSRPVQDLIAEIMISGNSKAIAEISQFSGMDDKTLSGVFSELSNHITVFATNDDLQRALNDEGRCITPQDLENGYDVFCCIPEHMLEEWKDLLGMICNQFLKAFENRGENNTKPILFLIDEFPRLGKVEAISNGLATLRSKKIHIALIVQSKSQLNAIYGKDIAEVIADNCSYKAILKASEPETQKWCSQLVGTYDKSKKSSSYNANMAGLGKGTGISTSTEEKLIIKPEEFNVMTDKVICIFPTGYRPLKKISCYEIGSPFFDNLPSDVQEETRKRLKEQSEKGA